MDKTDVRKSDGLWQFSENTIDSEKRATSSGLTDQYTFFIENGLITISLYSDQITRWKSEDDVYVLKTRWENNTLLYLPPVGDWTPLADFDGENFFMSDGINKKIFKKISKEKVPVWNSAVIKPGRSPFDYKKTF